MMTSRFLHRLAACVSAGFVYAAFASAQTCNLAPSGSTSQQVAVLRACLAQALVKNAAQDAVIAPLASQSAQIAALQGSLTTLNARVNGLGDQASALATLSQAVSTLTTRTNALTTDVNALKAWRLDIDASLADLADRLDALDGSGGPQAAIEPNTDDGRPVTQFGPSFLAWWDYQDPTIDASLQTPSAGEDGFCEKVGGGVATKAELLAAGIINPVTLMPSSMGPCSRIMLAVFRQQSEAYPSVYAGTWVVDWEGDADIDWSWCGGSGPDAVSTRRIERTFTAGTTGRCAIFATRIGPGGLTRVRAYRKAEEARLNSGEIWRPEFVNYVGRYKVVRPMDFQQVNGTPLRLADQQTTMLSRRWGGGHPEWSPTATPMRQFGVPLEASFDLAVRSNTALWLNVPPFLGAHPSFYVWWDPAAPNGQKAAAFTAAMRDNWQAMIASQQWDIYADRIVAAAISRQYPTTRDLMIELGNEIWNYANPFFIATGGYDAIGLSLRNGQTYQARYVYGYFSGRLAEAVDGALARAGRTNQRWTLVIASQNARSPATTDALDGFRAYFQAKGANPAPWFARVGVSVTSYTEDAFAPTAAFADLGFTTDSGPGSPFRAALLARIQSDPMAAAQRLADWTITATGDVLSIPGMIAFQAQHRAIALQYGARFLGDYEGENHLLALINDPAFTGSAAYRTMMREFLTGEQARRVQAARIAALRARPDGDRAIIADYGGPTAEPTPGAVIGAPWANCYYTTPCGPDTARNAILRPAQ